MSERVVCLADWQGGGLGWSRYELLHLHRTTNVLRDAGLCLETDSGVTDEGEPWFVLCEVGSDRVIAHFARISRVYIVYFPSLNRSLSESAFPDLIDRFLRQYFGRGHARHVRTPAPAASP